MKGKGRRSHYGYVIAAVSVVVVMGALGFGRFSFTVIYPGMMAGLGVGNTEMGLLASVNFLGYLLFSFIGGLLASRYGPRAVISFSLLAGGAAMVLTGLAGGIVMAGTMRFVTGLGSGGSNVPVMGLLSSWFAPRRRGMAAGLAAGGSGLGILVAGLLVPVINRAYPVAGWRVSWFFLGGLVALFGLVALVFLRNRPEELGLVPVGAPPGETPAPALKGKAPGLNWGQVYISPKLWHLAAIYLLFGFSYIIVINLYSAYLIKEVGLPERTAGFLWSLTGGLGIFSGFVWGALSDRIGRRAGFFLVFSLQGTGFILLALAKGYPGYLLATFLFGITAFGIPAVIAAAVGDLVGPKLAPAGLGLITIFFGLGQMVGPALAGYLADAYSTYTVSFFVAAAGAYGGALIALTVKEPRKDALLLKTS